MPLHLDGIPHSLTKGTLLHWILDTNEVKKPQVGSIEIRGRHAVIEVPDSAGTRLAKRLDGQELMGRPVQAWYAGAERDTDGSGHFQKLALWLDMEERAESEQAAERQRAAGDQDSSTALSMRQGNKVLACAPSNLGVDNLFERLLDAGENALRLGHGVRVLPHLRDRTLKAMVTQHREVRRVKQLRIDAAELFRKGERSSAARESRTALRGEARSLLREARDVEACIVQEVLDGADIVCATNTGLDPDLLGARRFDLVVIDEACQCSEPACWIPLLRAQRVVLAGDHCQLPPTIISQAAAREGFNVSLQERLVVLYGARLSRQLLVQYRMHADIMRYPSAAFYENRLEADTSVAHHRLCELPGVQEEESTTTPVRFIDTSGAGYDEEKEAAGNSLSNPEEAALTVRKVAELIASGVRPSDIAVITPYTAQVRLLRELLQNDAVDVGSIDGFQGREKEAVVISLVRSNLRKEIGFLSDTRRMNVALTRARRKLIVIGDSATITADPFYAGLLEHFDKIGAYHVIWEEET